MPSLNEKKFAIWLCDRCEDMRCRAFTVDNYPGERNCSSETLFPRWKLLYEGDEDPFREMIDLAYEIEELI